MKSTAIESVFNQSVLHWWHNLNGIIENAIYQGKKPILISLSRKMPRFMDWFKNHFEQETKIEINTSLLNQTEIATELAIPFYFFENDITNAEFILVDDCVIHGSTIENISNDIRLLTKKKCHIACIFRHINSHIPTNIILPEFLQIPAFEQSVVDEFCDIVSTIIRDNELPLDIEFPIFKIDTKILEDDSLYVSDAFEYMRSLRDSEFKAIEDYSTSDSASNNTDFFKVRFFNKPGCLKYEVFAPSIFTNDDLISDSKRIFTEKHYQDIWDKTTKKVRLFLTQKLNFDNVQMVTTLQTNFTRSLCVWANYLFSLSSYIKAKNIEIRRLPITGLNLEDISLILTPELSNQVIMDLNNLISEQYVNVDFREKILDCPNSFSPEIFSAEVETNKIIEGFLAEDVSELMTGIFKYQHYTNKKFDNHNIKYSRLFFGETHKSLKEAIEPIFDKSTDYDEMSQWIDSSIDAGYVIPKYEKCYTEDNTCYWRRFFHAGIRKFPFQIKP